MKELQMKIESYVGAYKGLFKQEYQDFLSAQKVKIDFKKDKYSKVNGGDGIIRRKLGEIPATLHAILETRLTSEEFQWFRSTEGARWFFKHYPEFRETEKI